jgi:hypothetical protein
VKRISPDPWKEERPALTSDQLVRLGQFLSGRFHLPCAHCGQEPLRLTVEGGELRIGSSPDLSEINPRLTSKPRLVFFCSKCKNIMGFVQGDVWSETPGDPPPSTRWNHLEFDETEATG